MSIGNTAIVHYTPLTNECTVDTIAAELSIVLYACKLYRDFRKEKKLIGK